MKGPPRLADWILKRTLPLGKRGESILGEYWQQALRLTFRYFTQPAPYRPLAPPRRSPMLMDLTSDLRTAIRMTLRNPGTSSLIVFTLALAIGAATIAFAFADLALFRGLPVDDPSRVVSTFLSDTRGSEGRGRVSGPDFLDYRARASTLKLVSVFRETSAALIAAGQSRTLRVSYATGELFAAMGQGAVSGRTLQSGDDRPGAQPVVMLSHRYWQEEYGGREAALGATMQIGRDVFTVVGVLTPEMEFANLAEIDVWLPLVVAPDAPRDVRNLRLVARLPDGVTFDSAAAELATIGDALAAEYPGTNAGWKVRLVPIRDLTGGDGFWVVIALFLLSIGLLMAIATANVSNLVIVRTVARQRELAVRAALGARRGRLVRQLVTEGLLLSIVSALVAIPVAWGGLQAVGAFSPELVFQQLHIDSHEFAFVALLALVCPLFFTLAPARMLARPDLRQVFGTSGLRGSSGSTRGRGALVVAQVALAVILLTASSLALRSITELYSSPTGMATGPVLIFGLNFNEALYPTTGQAQAALQVTLAALTDMPGAAVVATMSTLPILGGENYTAVSTGAALGPGDIRPTAVFTQSTPNAGNALGMAVLAGSWWSEGDQDAAAIARETAMRLFGGIDQAVGRRIEWASGSVPRAVRVAGVVSDIVSTNRTQGMTPRIWIPLDSDTRYLSFVVKTHGDPATLAGSVRQVAAVTAPAVPVEFLQTFDEELRRAASSDYVVIGLLTGFAVLALVLAATGLFGVVSYTVSQRTAEFGTRIALGASAADLVRLVGGQALVLLGIGLLIGLAGGVGVASAMGNVLYGVSPSDPVTLGLVVFLLVAVTLLATALPAWRASRTDPVMALRAE
ncbi:MAG: ADOP family duplicated permease [Acidobacteriota bacterium]|nr:ADOP family duplicated permease [Acidobacteriota bacterium]